MSRTTAIAGLIVGLALAVVVVAQAEQAKSAPPAPKGAALDGTTWQVVILPPGTGAKPVADTLVFRKDRFDSVACHQYGFGVSPYQSRSNKGVESFTSLAKGSKGDTMEWTGRTESNHISGSFRWRPVKGDPQTYTFSGIRETSRGLLDGTTWKVTLAAKGEKPAPDTLTFAQGRFDSTACHQYGFGKGPYQGEGQRKAISFTALTSSPKGGVMEWTGKVEGTTVSGTMLLRQEKADPKTYTFTGKKV